MKYTQSAYNPLWQEKIFVGCPPHVYLAVSECREACNYPAGELGK